MYCNWLRLLPIPCAWRSSRLPAREEEARTKLILCLISDQVRFCGVVAYYSSVGCYEGGMVWRFVFCLWSRKQDVVVAIKVASPFGAWVTQDHLLSNTLVLLECRQVISRWQETVQALSIQRKTDERS